MVGPHLSLGKIKVRERRGDRGFFTHPVVTFVANLSYVYSVEIYKDEDCISMENIHTGI